MKIEDFIHRAATRGTSYNNEDDKKTFELTKLQLKNLVKDFTRSEFERTLTKVRYSTVNDKTDANYFFLRKKRNRELKERFSNEDLIELLAQYRKQVRTEILDEIKDQSGYLIISPKEAKTQKEENNKEEQKESLETLARKRATEIHYLREASYYAPLNIVEKAREFLKENIFKENGKIKFEPYSLKVFLAQFVNKKFPNAELIDSFVSGESNDIGKRIEKEHMKRFINGEYFSGDKSVEQYEKSKNFEEKKKQAGGDADSIKRSYDPNLGSAKKSMNNYLKEMGYCSQTDETTQNKEAFPEIDSETATTTENIKKVCRSIMGVLVEKNNRYGNSALEPKKIFSGLNSEEGIRIRLDDKLGRIKNSQELRKNDVADLIGYAILLSVTKGWIFDDLID